MLILFSGGWKSNTNGTLRNSPQNRKCMRKGGDMAQRHNYTPCISKHQTNQEMILNSIAIVFPTRFVAVFLFALCVLCVFDVFWYFLISLQLYSVCFVANVHFWPQSCQYQRSWEKIFKTGGYFFWRLEMNTLLMEPCETIPKTGNVWERGGTWNIAIDHAFQNTKRIRKWYSTVLLLYFLRVLLLPSDLLFAFYVFWCFSDIFWLCYYCVLLFSGQCPFLPKKKMVNINQPFEEQILSKTNADTLFWRLEIKH